MIIDSFKMVGWLLAISVLGSIGCLGLYTLLWGAGHALARGWYCGKFKTVEGYYSKLNNGSVDPDKEND